MMFPGCLPANFKYAAKIKELFKRERHKLSCLKLWNDSDSWYLGHTFGRINASMIEKVRTERSREDGSAMAGIVKRNIEALLQREKKEAREQKFEERIADRITAFTGSMTFVYIHLAIFGFWIIWNSRLIGVKPVDPTFVILGMMASVEAIFLSTFVLISQNKMNEQANKRSELDLQVSLLAEHEVTRLIKMVSAIAEKLDLKEHVTSDIGELLQDVKPEKVLDTVERFREKTGN